MPVFENERGTFIFNSKDLCMIEHIPEMIEAGIDSFRVEGRMKSMLYVASIIRTYRMAIDDCLEDPENTGNDCRSTGRKSQNVLTGSIQQVSSLESLTAPPRSMMLRPMSKNGYSWGRSPENVWKGMVGSFTD